MYLPLVFLHSRFCLYWIIIQTSSLQLKFKTLTCSWPDPVENFLGRILNSICEVALHCFQAVQAYRLWTSTLKYFSFKRWSFLWHSTKAAFFIVVFPKIYCQKEDWCPVNIVNLPIDSGAAQWLKNIITIISKAGTGKQGPRGGSTGPFLGSIQGLFTY